MFWLATSAGRDNPSCPLFERRLCLGHIWQYNKLFIEQACLRTMPKYQPRSLRRALLSPYFGHPRAPRGSQTAVRRLGTIIRSIFFVPNQEPAFAWPFGTVWWESVPRASSAHPWKLSSRKSGASIRLTVWNGLVRVGTQGLFRPSLKTFVAPFLPTRLTAPGPLRMYFGKYKIIFITHIVTP